eukprot:GEMP01054937.1.p1 GENE.GEMP01054937.1~~GEMP01054937.1.p1  ORF type:complete len:186 (+),score=43.21 GEMP01054937.1:73-630(+)
MAARSIFGSLLSLIRHGEKGVIEVSFHEPCVYWISHATLGNGPENQAQADLKYSIPALPEGEYAINTRSLNNVLETKKVSLYPAKQVMKASYDWQIVPKDFAIPAGLEVKMDVSNANPNMAKIPEKWPLFGIKVERTTTIQQISEALGQVLLLDGKQIPGSLTAEDADLFNQRGKLSVEKLGLEL